MTQTLREQAEADVMRECAENIIQRFPIVANKIGWNDCIHVAKAYLVLERQLSECQAALREAQKNAERYRWLRTAPTPKVQVSIMDENEDGQSDTFYDYRGSELDAAIDAALDAKGEK